MGFFDWLGNGLASAAQGVENAVGGAVNGVGQWISDTQAHAYGYYNAADYNAAMAKNAGYQADVSAANQNPVSNFLSQNPAAAAAFNVAGGVGVNAPIGPTGSGATPLTNNSINNSVDTAAAQYNPYTSPPTLPVQPQVPQGLPTSPTYGSHTPPNIKAIGPTNAQLGAPTYLPPPPLGVPQAPQGFAVGPDGTFVPATDGSAGAGGIDPAALASATAPVTSSNSDIPGWAGPAASLAGAAVGGAASIVGANTIAGASTNAADVQAKAAADNVALQKQIWTDQQNNIKPWIDAGAAALPQIQSQINSYNPSQVMSQFQDPSYAWRLSEGLDALQNSAAGHAGLLSGATLKATNDYAQNAASQEYQNAYNRYNTSFGTKLNALQSLGNVGQTAVQQANQAGQNYGTQAGNAMTAGAQATAQGITGAASANASGYVGAANAVGQGVSNAYGAYQSASLLNALRNGGNY